MKAVVLKGPYRVACEERPTPQLTAEDQVVVKVLASGLCGSDLHWYRNHAKSDFGFILGHELVGRVVAKGKGVNKFNVGDTVVAPFSLSCGDCFYCQLGNTARCEQCRAFGTPTAEGGQAEYICLSMADSSLFKAPAGMPIDLMVLMADIIPTGYSVAKNALTLLQGDGAKSREKTVCVVIGCGPVGLCAISSACSLFDEVYATDIAIHRLEAAERHGAIALSATALGSEIARITSGRGADAALEVVGHESALLHAIELVRPFGVISSCGVHTQTLGLMGSQLYAKNIRLQFGRCSVPKYYEGGLKILNANRELFSTFVENKIRLEQATEYYELFEQNKIAKTIFVMDD